MPVVFTGYSAYDHELAKWEQFPSKHTSDTYDSSEEGKRPPGNPYVFRPYPRMLYKAQPSPYSNGQVKVMEGLPHRLQFDAGPIGDQRYQAAELTVMQFNTSCQHIVKSEAEHTKMRAQGWRDTPDDALAFHEGLQQDIARAAAEANAAAQRMTPKAQAERKGREDKAGAAQVAE